MTNSHQSRSVVAPGQALARFKIHRQFVVWSMLALGAIGGGAVDCVAQPLREDIEAADLHAPAGLPPLWLEGTAAREQFGAAVSITWGGLPLRLVVQNLSRSQRVGMVLDRRVDPTTRVELTVRDASLFAACEDLAASQDIGFTIIGPVGYFGPTSASRWLRTVLDQRYKDIERMPIATRARMERRTPAGWPRLSKPRDLLLKLAERYEVKFDNLDAIPHDLWPETSLPPLDFAEQATLLLAQFGYTFSLGSNANTIRLVPLPADPAITRSYNSYQDAERIAVLRAALPHATLTREGARLTLRGSVDEHERLRQLLAGNDPRKPKSVTGQKIYDLSVTMPVGKLVNSLAKRLGYEVEADTAAIAAAGLSLDTPVEVKVRGVNEDQLLDAATRPAGLTFRRVGRRLYLEVDPTQPAAKQNKR